MTNSVLIRSRFVGVILTIALSTFGCDSRPAGLSMRTVEMADIPETVRQAAERVLSDVEFTGAWQNVQPDGTVHSYEMRGKNSRGKIRECRVSPGGDILELE